MRLDRELDVMDGADGASEIGPQAAFDAHEAALVGRAGQTSFLWREAVAPMDTIARGSDPVATLIGTERRTVVEPNAMHPGLEAPLIASDATAPAMSGPASLAGGSVSSSPGGVGASTGQPVEGLSAGRTQLISQTFDGTFYNFSGNQAIDATLMGSRWTVGTLTYSFPTSGAFYDGSGYGDDDRPDGHITFTATQQSAVRYALGLISAYTPLNFVEITETASVHANLRFSQTSDSGLSSAEAYVPSSDGWSGDVWFGTTGQPFYLSPQIGNWGMATQMHELGHALGLKHGHENFTNVDMAGVGYIDAPPGGGARYGSRALPTDVDGQAWSLMTYRSNPGASLGFQGEGFNQPQTYMMYDIAALQYLYGADYTTNSGNTTYTWNQTTGVMSINGVAGPTPTSNKILATIWDGGGTDTYNLSSYTSNLTIDLAPGAFSTFSTAQLVNHRAHTGGSATAPGNIANALLFNGDTRSLIENAFGGSGWDTIRGNQANNVLQGQGGNDALYGMAGADILYGGDGADTLDGGSGIDTLYGGAGNDTYVLADINYMSNFIFYQYDRINETATGGTDTVRVGYASRGSGLGMTRTSYTLGEYIENGVVTGTQAFSLYGNDLNNSLTGNAAANTLSGGAGNDVIQGLGGYDTLIGGAGDDVYYLDSTTANSVGGFLFNRYDIVTEAADEGIDTIYIQRSTGTYAGGTAYDLPDNVENGTIYGTGNFFLYGNALNNTLLGSTGVDTLRGHGGDDILNGRTGADTLEGGAGNDLYILDTQHTINDGGFIRYVYDTVVEGADAGHDTVHVRRVSTGSTVWWGQGTYTLTDNVEDGVVLGLGGMSLHGNASNNALTGGGGADHLYGEAGDDTLTGGGGVDTFYGGAGNDAYWLDADDIADESVAGSDGVDTIQAGFTISLATHANLRGAFENLVLTGTSDIDGAGNDLDNVITGNAGANTLSGAGGADSLNGGAGNDVLDGGDGADVLTGGTGDDTYHVERTGDVIIELAGEGVDLVRATSNYTLGANVENGIIATTSGRTLNGNVLNNVLTGNDGADVLDGKAGDDVLDGGAGIDTLRGGLGDDTFHVDRAGDVIVELEGEGTDTAYVTSNYTLGDNVENGVVNTVNGRTLNGNALANILIGNAGADVLDGKGGADEMRGGLGNDTYYVNATGDVVIEASGGGYDTVYTTTHFNAGTQEIEEIILTGTLDRNLTGSQHNNILRGNSGNNILDGGTGGADDMYGGAGNDTYILNSTSDRVFELAGGGYDTVYVNNNFSVGTQEIEEVILIGTLARNLTGGAGANVLRGNAAANILDGGAGVDTLYGGAGNDTYYVDASGDTIVELAGGGTDTVYASSNYTLAANVENGFVNATGARTLTGNALNNQLTGNIGADTLVGGGGADTLTGGAGADRFKFNAVSDTAWATYDTITDLSNSDIIDLSTIDANSNLAGNQAFVKVSAFTGVAGQVRLVYSSATGDTYVQGDIDGDGVGDFRIRLTGDHRDYDNFVL